VIYNHQLRPGILRSGVSHYHGDIDETLMHQAAQLLLGEHDFTSFRAVQCQSNTPFRNVHKVNVTRQGMYVMVDIQANAFLHHMVRNIVGSLLEIGLGNQPISWISELLALKDRNQAAATAKPNGLYLVDVTYPEQYQIPKLAFGPLFMLD
jgi:tRNA pseudouridine38-40 synthase